jgi:hypothetical protein
MIPFLIGELDALNLFMKYRIEDYLYDFLSGQKNVDQIVSQVFKTLILMHISSNMLNLTANDVGGIFVKKGGLTTVI